MPLERGLALGFVLALQFIRDVLLHDNIRIDAFGLDRTTRGREVKLRRQLQRAIFPQREDRLHRALAEGACADDRGALLVLQGTGDNLRSGGRPAIDQHDNLLALDEIAGARLEALGILGLAGARRNNLALFEEGIRDRDCLIEQAAGIVPEIEDIALDLVLADFLRDVLDTFFSSSKVRSLKDPTRR